MYIKQAKCNISKGDRVALQTMTKTPALYAVTHCRQRQSYSNQKHYQMQNENDRHGGVYEHIHQTQQRPHIQIQEQTDQHPKELEEKWIHLRETVREAILRFGRNPQIVWDTHTINTPLWPIVSSCGSITYKAAKCLASILTPLVDKHYYRPLHLFFGRGQVSCGCVGCKFELFLQQKICKPVKKYITNLQCQLYFHYAVETCVTVMHFLN